MTFFNAPFDLFKEKKLEGTMNLFEELKMSKIEKTAQHFEKQFYKQIFDFHCPSKILCHASKLWNFVKITGPYWWDKPNVHKDCSRRCALLEQAGKRKDNAVPRHFFSSDCWPVEHTSTSFWKFSLRVSEMFICLNNAKRNCMFLKRLSV
jgi:hypothetical protein